MLLLLRKLYVSYRGSEQEPGHPPAPAAAAVPSGNPLVTLFTASVKMLVRDRRTVVVSLVLPVLFVVVFGLIGYGRSPTVSVAVVPRGSSAFTEEAVSAFLHDPTFSVRISHDVARARSDLRNGKLGLAVVVPDSKATPLTAYYRPNDTTAAIARGDLEQLVNGLNLRLAGVTSPEVRLRARTVYARDTNYYDFLLPGLVAMGLMNFSIIGVAIAGARFREQRILRRIMATPLRPATFLAAQVGARLLLALVQTATILALGVWGFGAHVYGDVVWIFVLALLGNVVFLNIGFALAGQAKNADSAQALAQLVTLPMLFLSGVFFPTDTLPHALTQVVRVLPLTPLATGLHKIALDGDSIGATWPQLALLAVWVVVSLVLAAAAFRFDDERGLRLRRRGAGARAAPTR